MKAILILVLSLILTGCSSNNGSVDVMVNDAIERNLSTSAVKYSNNSKELYAYYLPVNIGKVKSTPTSNIFKQSNYEIVMNLDVSAVISNLFYEINEEKYLNKSNCLFYNGGTFKDARNNKLNYAIFVYQDGDGYYVEFNSNYFDFYSKVHYDFIDDVIDTMFTIAKSAKINVNEIVSAYSSRPKPKLEVEKEDIYDVYISEEGPLEELLGDSEYNGEDGDWNIEYFDLNGDFGSGNGE